MKPDIKERLLATDDLEAQECPICFDALQSGVIIQQCGHLFCAECINAHLSNAADGGDQDKTCPSCRGRLDKNRLISVTDFYAKFAPEKIEESKKEEEELSQKEASQPNDEWKSSTKIDQLMILLESTRQTHPGEKTIVFSQFVGMLDLIETPLRRSGFNFVRVCFTFDVDLQ